MFTLRILVYLSLFLLVFTACAHSQRLNEVDVLALANEAATKSGYSLEDYKKPKIHFELTKKGRWTVFFYSKLNPLIHFLVWVDDQTGNTEVMLGE